MPGLIVSTGRSPSGGRDPRAAFETGQIAGGHDMCRDRRHARQPGETGIRRQSIREPGGRSEPVPHPVPRPPVSAFSASITSLRPRAQSTIRSTSVCPGRRNPGAVSTSSVSPRKHPQSAVRHQVDGDPALAPGRALPEPQGNAPARGHRDFQPQRERVQSRVVRPAIGREAIQRLLCAVLPDRRPGHAAQPPAPSARASKDFRAGRTGGP